MSVIVEHITQRSDARGSVWEPLRPEELASQHNVHVVFTEPGAVRGNHFHTHGTEILTVQGPALVRWDDDGTLNDLVIPLGDVVRFTIPPGIPHAVQNNGLRTNMIVAFNTAAHDPAHPDSVSVKLI